MKRLAILLAMMLAPASVEAGRPLITDDPGTIEKGTWQIELGAAYYKADTTHHGDFSTTLTYGLIAGVEIQVGGGLQQEHHPFAGRASSTDEGVTDVSFAAKWLFVEQGDASPVSLGLSGNIAIPTADRDRGLGEGTAKYDLTLLVERDIEQLTLLFNVGYLYVTNRRTETLTDVLHYSFAATYELTPVFQPVAEFVVESPVDFGRTSSGVNLGIRWNIMQPVTLDFAVGTRVTGDWPVLSVTTGLTWVF